MGTNSCCGRRSNLAPLLLELSVHALAKVAEDETNQPIGLTSWIDGWEETAGPKEEMCFVGSIAEHQRSGVGGRSQVDRIVTQNTTF